VAWLPAAAIFYTELVACTLQLHSTITYLLTNESQGAANAISCAFGFGCPFQMHAFCATKVKNGGVKSK